jgi:hypothetical protein
MEILLRGQSPSVSTVYHLPQLFAGFEKGDLLGGDMDGLASFGVPTIAGVTLPDSKAAKSTEFDLIFMGKRIGDAREERVDDHLRLFLGQLDLVGHTIDQVSFRH